MSHHEGGHVREVMTKDPITLENSASVVEAAKAMRDSDVGPVIVTTNGQICGIVTDRDIVIRLVAEGKDINSATVGEICSSNPATVSPDDGIQDVITLMREKAIRRVPVVENGKAIGIVSMGDLAGEHDLDSAIEGISDAAPNN